MDYAYFSSGQPQAAFHQQQFSGYPTTAHSQSGIAQAANIYTDSTSYEPLNATYQQFNSNSSFIQQPQPQQQPSPPLHHDSIDSAIHLDDSSKPPALHNDYSIETADQDGNRSDSDEKESMTPAQSRRKAQNRAAQRAFRERKERHVKDLETKLHSLSAHSSTLLSDNERLKRELQRLATQNEILRATSSQSGTSQSQRSPSPVHGPQVFSPIDFQAGLGEGKYPVSFEDFGGPQGERLLAVGAAWDLIVNSEECRSGRVRIEEVHERLKGLTFCNGRGPSFREQDVRRAIEESVLREGGDGLL